MTEYKFKCWKCLAVYWLIPMRTVYHGPMCPECYIKLYRFQPEIESS